MAGRTLVSKLSPFLVSTRSPALRRLRPLIAAGDGVLHRSVVASVSGGALRSFSSRPTTSSLNDPSPNWSNRPPKETILLDGCDFEHWLVVMEPPEPNATRDEIIDSYIKTLAEVVGRSISFSISTLTCFLFFTFRSLICVDETLDEVLGEFEFCFLLSIFFPSKTFSVPILVRSFA